MNPPFDSAEPGKDEHRSGHARFYRQVDLEWRGMSHGEPVYGPKWVVEEVTCRTVSVHDSYEDAVGVIWAMRDEHEEA